MKLFAIYLGLLAVVVKAENDAWDDIRLAGANSNYRGRVEIRRNGEWGTVCDDKWSLYDADVACKQLGFDGAETVRMGGFYGPGTGPIHIDDMNCRNIEDRLDQCPARFDSSDCDHSEDAGVDCKRPVPQIRKRVTCRTNQYHCKKQKMCIPIRWTCDGQNDCGDNSDEMEEYCGVAQDTKVSRVRSQSLNLRLVNGRSTNEGRVELMHDGEWGTICDDHFELKEANVVCKQLGFKSAAQFTSGFGPGDSHIWIDELKCTGNETTIADCERNPWGSHDCTHSEDIGVVCEMNPGSVKSTVSPKKCGESIVNKHDRVLGGYLARVGAWPWQGSLRLMYQPGAWKHVCGVTLIAPNWVITAAHCFENAKDTTAFNVRLGEHDFRYAEVTERDYNISKLVVHSPEHDIVLLQLGKDADLNSEVINTACLPNQDETFTPYDTCFGTGWGNQGFGFEFTLKQMNLPIISNEQCIRDFGMSVNDKQICAGRVYGGKLSCQGDSGSPLVCLRDGHWVLAGIGASGQDCTKPNTLGVYTQLSKHVDWIQNSMK